MLPRAIVVMCRTFSNYVLVLLSLVVLHVLSQLCSLPMHAPTHLFLLEGIVYNNVLCLNNYSCRQRGGSELSIESGHCIDVEGDTLLFLLSLNGELTSMSFRFARYLCRSLSRNSCLPLLAAAPT